jgi:hypothetical protein
LLPGYDVEYQTRGTLDQLKANIDSGKMTLVGVSWQTNQDIVNTIWGNIGKTKWNNGVYVGHWMVAIGYNDVSQQIIFLDLGINTTNPADSSDFTDSSILSFTAYTYDKLATIFTQIPNSFIGSGNMITIEKNTNEK